MKRLLYIIILVCCLTACSSSRESSELSCPANTITEGSSAKPDAHSSCPPAAFGAEKLLGYLDKRSANKHPTAKTDPVSGKKTSQAKGIRKGELEKPHKPTKEERREAKRKRLEQELLEKQIKKDEKDFNKEQILF